MKNPATPTEFSLPTRKSKDLKKPETVNKVTDLHPNTVTDSMTISGEYPNNNTNTDMSKDTAPKSKPLISKNICLNRESFPSAYSLANCVNCPNQGKSTTCSSHGKKQGTYEPDNNNTMQGQNQTSDTVEEIALLGSGDDPIHTVSNV